MGGYSDEELQVLYSEGHFLPTDNYWRDGMAEWGTLAELLGDTAAPGPETIANVETAAAKKRSPAHWIVPTAAAVIIVIVGVVITVTYFSRKMAEAGAPIMRPPESVDSLPDPLPGNGPKSTDLLRLPDNPSEPATNDEAATVMKNLEQLSSSCRDSEKDMLLLGFDPSRLTSLDEIEKRRQSITIVLPRIQAVLEYITHLDQKVRSDLQARNVPAADIDSFIDDMHRNRKQDALLKYWQEENAIAGTMLENLKLLRANYGKWHLDDNTVVFNDPAMLSQYRANVETLKADIATQQAAQAEIKPATPASSTSP